MPIFQRADELVNKMAAALLNEFETHTMLLTAKAKIDFVFAFGDRDDQNRLTGPALKKNGLVALGMARKIALKDRALGRGDAEISLDGDWWEEASLDERRALLDHELHHITVKVDDRGIVTDDLPRPVIQLRKHDHEVGWFSIIAQRHGVASQERIQAKAVMDSFGQLFWPGFTSEHTDETERVIAKAVRGIRMTSVRGEARAIF